MNDAVKPAVWLRHLETSDELSQFIVHGGSLLRVVTSCDQQTHNSLVGELFDLSNRLGLKHLGVERLDCSRLYSAPDVVSSAASKADFTELFTQIARRIWKFLGPVDEAFLLDEVRFILRSSPLDLRADFRSEMNQFLEHFPGFSRDFRVAVRSVLLEIIVGGASSRDALQRVESYFLGTAKVRELRDIGIQRKLARETATRVLRNLFELNRATGSNGTLLHLDFRWISDHELAPSNSSARPASKSQRVATYQWIRELIDGSDQFSSSLICVEFGPNFPDPNFRGRGWGLYDALRLRLEDGVRPVGGPNLSAPFIPLTSSC